MKQIYQPITASLKRAKSEISFRTAKPVFFYTMRVFISVALLLSMITQQSLAQKDYRARIDSFLEAQIREFHIPALSAVIVDNGQIKYMRTYGKANLEYNIPNTDTTSFQLASSTKLISATAIMLLVQEGKLDLNERVRTYLPDLPVSWNDMRVMDLLAHQSGIADLLALKQNFSSVKSALDTAAARPLDFAPGSKTVYAGGDYAVVMMLIEKISGKPFQDFLKTNLLQRLGMTHTAFNNMEQDFIYRTYDILPHAATTYSWNDKTQKQQIFSMMFPSWTYPAGGLFSSISDLSRWVIALDRNTILTEDMQDKMWTPAKLRNGNNSPFGVGWIVDKYKDEKATGHSGGPALSDIVRVPGKKVTAIVLTNQLNLRPFLCMKVLDFYMQGKKTANDKK